MEIADLIQLFDVRDLPMLALQHVELHYMQTFRTKGELATADAAMFMAVRSERRIRLQRAMTAQVAP